MSGEGEVEEEEETISGIDPRGNLLRQQQLRLLQQQQQQQQQQLRQQQLRQQQQLKQQQQKQQQQQFRRPGANNPRDTLLRESLQPPPGRFNNLVRGGLKSNRLQELRNRFLV